MPSREGFLLSGVALDPLLRGVMEMLLEDAGEIIDRAITKGLGGLADALFFA